MNKCYFILLSCLLPMITFSCKAVVSDVAQITREQYTCVPSQDQDEENSYYKKYGMNNPKITVDGYRISARYGQDVVKKAFSALSNVPEEYLIYSFKNPYNIPVNLYTSNIGGLTSTYDFPEMYPVAIKRSDIRSLPHEFGHASMGYVIKHNPDMLKDLKEISNLILKDKNYREAARYYIINNVDIRTNAQRTPWQQEKETFAEIFDTWYCSKATRTNLEKVMPKVHEFAKKYLLTPRDE